MRREATANGVVSAIPRVLVGAVDGVEVVAVGALQLARDVLLSTVSGAANIGAEALSATTAAARGVVSATSSMVGDIASTAQGTFRDTLYNATHARPGARRIALGASPARHRAEPQEAATVAPVAEARPRKRTRRARPATTREAA